MTMIIRFPVFSYVLGSGGSLLGFLGVPGSGGSLFIVVPDLFVVFLVFLVFRGLGGSLFIVFLDLSLSSLFSLFSGVWEDRFSLFP